jgi:chemotaxis signal transduction protein
VLVVAVDGVRFGLHVLEVVGLQRCADDELGPPPLGQRAGPAGARHDGLIAATVRIDDELVLVADARSLAALL